MAMGIQSRFHLAPIALAVCICATATAWGEPVATPASDVASGGGLEEIVVTARKASEPLQTTPVAVTAFSGAALIRDQIVEVADLQQGTPDIAIGGGGTGPSSIVYLAIRGEAQNSPNSASDNAVGIYVDGVYLARPIVGNYGFLDVSQVEVLRGPQGTLFGRNTTGGALNITTNQPTDTFEGYVQGDYGNFNSKLGEAVVNLPLVSGTLDSRVAFRWADHSAYYTNPLNSMWNTDDVLHDMQGRAQLKWTPDGVPLKIVWSFDYADERDTGIPTALVGFNANSTVAGPVPLGVLAGAGLALAGYPGATPNTYLVNPYSQHNNNYRFNYGGVPTNADNPDSQINNPFDENIAQGFTQNLDADIGSVHLKSISAYRWSNSGNSETLAGMPINYYAFVSQYYQHQASQELQFSGKNGNFDWIGGTYLLPGRRLRAFGLAGVWFSHAGIQRIRGADQARSPSTATTRTSMDALSRRSARPTTTSPIRYAARSDTGTPGMSGTSPIKDGTISTGRTYAPWGSPQARRSPPIPTPAPITIRRISATPPGPRAWTGRSCRIPSST